MRGARAPSYGTGGEVALPSRQELATHRKVLAVVVFVSAMTLAVSVVTHARSQPDSELLSEWGIDSDLTPALIAERRHPMRAVKHEVPLLFPSAQKAVAKKQMLMYGKVELPTENFSFKLESGAPQCDEGCAFQDKVFTVEGFDKLCLTHCGEIDGMLKDASQGQRQSITLAQKVVRQQLAAIKVNHGSNSLFKTLSAKFVGKKAATAATHPLNISPAAAAAPEKLRTRQGAQMEGPEGEKLQAKDAGKGSWTTSPNFNVQGWPIVGDKSGPKLTNLLVNHEHEAWKEMNNFNQKGYWPLKGNENKLKKLDLNVDGWGIKEHHMPEQYSGETVVDPGIYQHFFDTGKKLQGAGVRVSVRDDASAKASAKAKVVQLDLKDPNFKVSGYWPLAGEPNKLAANGLLVDGMPQGKERPMPEQYSEEDPLQVGFYKHFFDTGSRLETEGVNIKRNPVGDENVNGDDRAFKRANINMYQWPWDQ